MPDFVFDPIVTVPFLPSELRLTLAVVAALATVTFKGIIPQNITTASTNDSILLNFLFVFILSFPFCYKFNIIVG